jgi:hypothetical protein
MKAEEATSVTTEEKPDAQTNENTTVVHEQVPPAQGEGTNTPNEPSEQNSTSVVDSERKTETIEIDGKQVSIDELKGGYLRQSDYTQKTQELARKKKELEKAEAVYTAMHSDEETAQEISERLGIEYVSPKDAGVEQLTAQYHELLLEREIEKLQANYGTDFDVTEVLQLAYDKRIDNLEDAYLLVNAKRETTAKPNQSLDIESIKEQIRQELKQELQSTVDTSTTIRTGGSTAPITDDTPQLSSQELKVASAMKMSPKDYAKWKNKK